MPSLVVPGVRVETRFDVLPPLPAPSGIVGVAGIVDRPPDGLVGASRASELRELLGPGTEVSAPEAVHALANGAAEVVLSAVAGGSPAFVDLNNDDAQPAARLRARSNGTWAHALVADVSETRDPTSNDVVRVTLRLLQGGRQVETFSDLQVRLGAVDDLFDVVNRQSRYVVAVDPGHAGALPAEGTVAFDADGTPIDVDVAGGNTPLLQLTPASGASPDGLSVRIDTEDEQVEVQVFQRGLQEHFTELSMDPDDPRYLPFLLAAQSRLLRVRTHPSRAEGRRLPRATTAPLPLANGVSPNVAAWQAAIDRLTDDTRIDLVVAAVEPTAARDDVLAIHESLLAHAVTAADDGAPRIAFGAITPGEQDGTNDADEVREHSSRVRNRRFVLVAPTGAAGIVAGAVGRLNPQDSPTFKPVPLLGLAPARYRASELNRLLGPTVNLAVVQDRVGRGVVLLRGLNTFGDQISVQRVADQCIRETKAIAENFIGELNTEDARIALREQIIATFTRMERAGALVPSTDLSDPAFVVDVYSTQQDFAQGIVRIDIAVRPVRAIDYVYATIRVKN
ncbi:MAG TPA: phage tail sheath C-terminal domain-containing protein [Solirubrobacteraceae bacterium]|nr:phage tail sheath C-terminal domain-containing protein [Solirubrobacteraceae bacterium]